MVTSQALEYCDTIETLAERFRGAATTSCNHLARAMPATQRPPGAPKTPCLVPHACCRRGRRRSWKKERDPVHETPCNISPCLPVQRGATVSFWNTRESTFQNRYVHLPQRRVYWLLCSEHLQGDSGWNARRVPLSTEISWESRRFSWRLATPWFIDTIVEWSGSVSEFFSPS